MKSLFFILLVLFSVYSYSQVREILSEDQFFVTHDEASNGDYIGVVKAYPEVELEMAPVTFSILSNSDGIYEINGTTGLITISDNLGITSGQDSVSVRLESGSFSTDITVKIVIADADNARFIDLDASVDGNETLLSPGNNFTSISNGDTVFIKRGTSISSNQVFLNNASDVHIDAYGVGNKPIFSCRQVLGRMFTIGANTNNVTFKNLEVTGDTYILDPADTTIQTSGAFYISNETATNISIIGCEVHHVNGSLGVNKGSLSTDFGISWCNIHHISGDGIYIKGGINKVGNPALVACNYIWRVNELDTIYDIDSKAFGDHIQLDTTIAVIRNNYFDKTRWDHKFAIISGTKNGCSQYIDNYFKMSVHNRPAMYLICIEGCNGGKHYIKGNHFEDDGGDQEGTAMIHLQSGDAILEYNQFYNTRRTYHGQGNANYTMANNVYYNVGSVKSVGFNYGHYTFKNEILKNTPELGGSNSETWEHTLADNSILPSGINNISGDANFVDDNILDLRLQPSSDAIRAGTNEGVASDKDYYGNSLPFIRDIGSHQYTSDTSIPINPNCESIWITTGNYIEPYFADFNGYSDGDLISDSVNWLDNGASPVVRIDSRGTGPRSNGNNEHQIAYYNATFEGDQFIESGNSWATSASWRGLALNCSGSGSTFTGYVVRTRNNTPGSELYRFDNSVPQLLASSNTMAVRFEHKDDTLFSYDNNGVLISDLTYFDSTYSAGSPGIYFYGYYSLYSFYDDLTFGELTEGLDSTQYEVPAISGIQDYGDISIEVNCGAVPYTFEWSDGDTSQNRTELSIGNYWLLVTDANNITSDTAKFVVSEEFDPCDTTTIIITGSITNDINSSSSGSIDASVTGGTGVYTYSWNTGAITEDISSLEAGTYILTVADENACQGTKEFIVESINQSFFTENSIGAFIGQTIPVRFEPVNIDIQSGISYQFRLKYDDEFLSFKDFDFDSEANPGIFVEVFEESDSVVSIGIISSVAINNLSEILLINLYARNAGNATLEITDLYIDDTLIANIPDANVIIESIDLFGDVNFSSVVNAYDAAITLQYSVDLEPLPQLDPNPWIIERQVTADVDGFAGITALDAAEILKYSVGTINEFPVEIGLNQAKSSSDEFNVEAVVSEEKVTFVTRGEFYGVNIFTENTEVLGTPKLLATNMMYATNITEGKISLGICSSESPEVGTALIEIPILSNDEISFELVGQKQQPLHINGITQAGLDETIVLYPNPADNRINLTGLGANANIEIYSISGELIETHHSSNGFELNISGYSKGTYLMKIYNSKGFIKNKKFFKK